MWIKERFQRWFKPRFAVLYPMAIYIVFFTQATDRAIGFGIGFILAGLAVRVWANGYAIKMDKLTTSGPYAFVRNPLYLGTALLVVGAIIMLNIYLVGAAFLLITVAVYYQTVKKEEGMLAAKFGQKYLDYKKEVPAIWPTFVQYQAGEKWPFSFARVLQSREHKVVLWVIIIVIAFHLKQAFLVEKEAMSPRAVAFIAVCVILALIDIVMELTKAKGKAAAA